MTDLIKRYAGAAEALAKIAENNSLTALEKIPNHIMRAIHQASAVQQFQELLTDDLMRSVVMPLQNNALGFRTDKASDGYPVHVVREAVVEALMRGFHISGNEFNIIAGRFYAAQAGFVRLCNEHAQGIRYAAEIKSQSATGALVLWRMDWSVDGKADFFERSFSIRINSGMGPDAILGKAKRKAFAYLWEILSGIAVDEGDGGDVVETGYTENSKPSAPPVGKHSVRKPVATPEPAKGVTPQEPAETPANEADGLPFNV
jgi:hypothetical protein